jgi:hypothetical protein
MGEPIPADIEKRISDMVAEAAQRVSQTAMREAEQQKQAEQMQDPLLQIKAVETEIKKADMQRKAIADKNRNELANRKQNETYELEKERIAAEKEIEGAKLGRNIAKDLMDEEQDNKKIAREDYQKGVDIGLQIAKDMENDKSE